MVKPLSVGLTTPNPIHKDVHRSFYDYNWIKYKKNNKWNEMKQKRQNEMIQRDKWDETIET